MKEEVTAIGLRQGGGAIASLRSSVATFDFLTGEVCQLPCQIVHQADMPSLLSGLNMLPAGSSLGVAMQS
jgi:hypothetical protein